MWWSVLWMMLVLRPIAGDEVDLAAHMQQHFSQATLIQEALIRADLERARDLAGWLIEHEPPAALPSAWQPQIAEFKAEARRVRTAGDLPAAAEATARMAAACGSCHRQHGVNTWLNSTSDAPLGEHVSARMARHRWAVDRMWEGLVGPSEPSWQQGAEELAEDPLPSYRLLGEEQIRAEILANQVYRLGVRARQVSSPEGRAVVYGRLLAICAECHGMFRTVD